MIVRALIIGDGFHITIIILMSSSSSYRDRCHYHHHHQQHILFSYARSQYTTTTTILIITITEIITTTAPQPQPPSSSSFHHPSRSAINMIIITVVVIVMITPALDSCAGWGGVGIGRARTACVRYIEGGNGMKRHSSVLILPSLVVPTPFPLWRSTFCGSTVENNTYCSGLLSNFSAANLAASSGFTWISFMFFTDSL